jgi:hypothetical protein
VGEEEDSGDGLKEEERALGRIRPKEWEMNIFSFPILINFEIGCCCCKIISFALEI